MYLRKHLIKSKVYPKLHKIIGPTALCQVMQFYFTLSLQEYSKCQDSLVHILYRPILAKI